MKIYEIFRKVLILSLAVIIIGTGLLGSLNIGADSVFDNIAYAEGEEDKEEDKDESKEEGEKGKSDATTGSVRDNLKNVLGENKASNSTYMANLNHVLGYDKRTHYLTTLAVLNSSVMEPGEYAKVYSGTYKPEGLPEDYSALNTNGTTLFDRLSKLNLDGDEEAKQSGGLNDEVVKEIFGKARAELTGEEKEQVETLSLMAQSGAERERVKKSFEKQAAVLGADYICNTGFVSSGYGGAGFTLIQGQRKETVKDGLGGLYKFTHNIEPNYETKNKESKGLAVNACKNAMLKFDKSNKAQADGLTSAITASLIKNGGKYSKDTATNIITNVRESGGTLSGKYPELNSKVTTITVGDLGELLKGDNMLKNFGITLLSQAADFAGFITNTDSFQSNVHYTLGNGEFDEEKYSNVGSATKDEFKGMLNTLNEVYAESDSKFKALKIDDFKVSGKQGEYKFENKKAYDTLNEFMTLNLISTVAYNKEVDGYKDFKEEKYAATVAPLAKDIYILFKKHESLVMGSAVDESVKDIRALGWAPLYYVKQIHGDLSEDKYKGLMDRYDGTTIPGQGRFLGTGDGTRNMKVKDIVAMEKDGYSPLAAVDSETGKAPYQTGVGGQTDYRVSLAYFGGLKLKDKKIEPYAEDETRTDKYGAYQKAYRESGIAGTLNGEEALGMDNYGNMIVGNGLSVVVPYWHALKIDGSVYASPLYKTVKDASIGGSEFLDTKSSGGENSFASIFDKRKMDLTTAYANTAVNSTEAVKEAIKGGSGYESQLRKIAYRITEATEDEVKKHNEDFVKAYEAAYDAGQGELYITSASLNEDAASELDDLRDEFTEADIIHKIAMMLKYGAADFLRLTFVGFFVDFYNTTVYNFNIEQVFYSTTIVDSAFFKGILPNITVLIGAITVAYWGYSVFNLWRGRLPIKRFLGVTVALTFVLIIPFLYATLINVGMNSVSDKMLGKQTRQMMVVDSWTRSIEKAATEDSDYSRLYGYNSNLEFRDSGQDYILEFATTTAISNGCDVVNPKELYCQDYAYKKDTTELKDDWKKEDLVTVNVSLYDVLEWMDEITETVGSGGTYDTSLFEYLQGRSDAGDKGYSALSEYTEYSVDTSVLLKDLGLGQNAFAGEVVSASSLLQRIHVNANTNDELINSLGELTGVYNELLKNPEVSNEEVKYVIRDLSMTRKSREALHNGQDKLSPVTESVSQRASIGMTPPGFDLTEHSGDMFNLYGTVEKLDPHRTPGYKKELEEDIFRLNQKTIESYFSDFALVRKSVGGDSDPSYKRTEANIMSTVLWFNINSKFDFGIFPQEYDGRSVSLDNYMRVAYIPIGVFSDPTVSASGEYGYTNVGEYLSLRENVFNLLVFALSIILMVGYALIKWAVIHVVLLLLTIYGFAKNYVFQYNPDNKFGLGALVIYGTFIVINALFNGMWWAFGYALNNSYAANDGAVGYPAVVIHSIITILVMIFIIFFVFRKLFKNVRGDMANLGGNNFHKDFKKMQGRMKGMMNGVMRSNENKGQSAYMEESQREGGDAALSKDEVKRSNDLGDRNLKAVVNDDSTMTSNFIMSELDNSQRVANNPESILGAMGGVINSRTPSGIALGNTLADYDSINTDGNSLISNEDKRRYDSMGNYGAKLSESGTGNSISVLGFGNTDNGRQQAQSLGKYLSQQGIKSSVDKSGQVMFDSGKYNMSTPSGRKTLLGGFMKQVADNVSGNSAPERGNVDNNTTLSTNFDYTVGDKGLVTVGVGGESGINPSVLSEMLTQSWFGERFEVDTAYAGKGKEGNIVLKPLATNAEEVDTNMSELFKEDTKIRDREGIEERVDSPKNDKVLKFNGKNSEVFNLVKQEFEANKGVKLGAKLHANSLVFDGSKREHRNIIKNVENKLKDKYTDDAKTAQQIATKLGNFVVKGAGETDEEELGLFRRSTKKTRDGSGNVMFNVNNAKEEAKNGNLNMGTIKGMNVEKSTEDASKQTKSMHDGLRELDELDAEELRNKATKKSVFGGAYGARNTVKDTTGNQQHSASNMSQVKQSHGTGLSFGRLNTRDNNVKQQVIKSGLMGDKVNTTVYGGDEFGKKINSFNTITQVVAENKEDVEKLTTSKDRLLQAVDTKIGKVGSETRAKELVSYISSSGVDAEMYRSVRTMYDKLNDDYNSGNIESSKYKYGIKDITKKIEDELKKVSKYDAAMISMVQKGETTGEEREIAEDYRSAKSNLIKKDISSETIEKLDGRTYNKMMAFVTRGDKVAANEDSQTFDVESESKLSDTDTKDIHKMINDIA